MNIGVLASGRGSILEAILEQDIPVSVVVVDRKCGAIKVAEKAGVPVELVERTDFGPGFDRDAYTKDLIQVLEKHGIELVVLAGFMTIFSRPFLERWPGKILNTHPALLPAFRGAHAVEEAFRSGVKITGCTIHVVTEELDAGPILAQQAVPVLPDDDVESLHERIKEAERVLYPRTIKALIS